MTVPVRELTTENLRILIGQQIGLECLVPLALDALEQSPFESGDYYPGDLLTVVREFPRVSGRSTGNEAPVG